MLLAGIGKLRAHGSIFLKAILAFEINTGKDEYINAIGPAITREALDAGIYLRPLGNTVYIMPPYCSGESELGLVYDAISDIADNSL